MRVDETSIRQWADRHECRSKLPILVRRLIRETTPSLSSLRFPGNEAVDMAGLDGQCEAHSPTAWVPQGRSVWEMGCNQDISSKANGDFKKRTAETPEPERKNSSFIFVTPRRWSGKEKWLADTRREGSWSAVLAYDAADLETWLEEAPATSRWLGELIGIAHTSLLTPHEWWQRWSTASAPSMPMALVANRRLNEATALVNKLREGSPVVAIQADDKSEAVAFVVATLIKENALDLLDRTLVATSSDAKIDVSSGARLIIVVDGPEGQEPDFGDRTRISIVRAYPRGRADVQDSLQLSHVSSEAFRSELEAMGLARDDAENLARNTGHSIPVLRRYLSPDPEIRRPVWARDRDSAKRLLPFALAGAWVERENYDDAAIVQLLGQIAEGDVGRIRDDLLALDDAPLAKYGNVNIAVSQLDALFALGPYIQRDDLDRFFQLLPELLGDRDPALDLPQDQWWMANVLGKARHYSGGLLSGLGDTLCILAIHGEEICGRRLHVDLAYRASEVVRTLMRNATAERWLSIRGLLRTLAEAAPTAFLDCLEEELQRPDPTIRAIMGTTGGAGTGECLRTNLLWALELLAWHPTHFSRVAGIIFELRRFEITDNWVNSPASTAKSLFRAWLPGTALDVAERMRVLKRLSERFRHPAIDVCVSLLPDGGPAIASRPASPQWRRLEYDVSAPTYEGIQNAAEDASRLLLDLAPYDKAELKELLEVAHRLHPNDLKRLVDQTILWASKASDEEKAELRHDLRRRSILRLYREENDADFDTAFETMVTALEPTAAISRHRWLFDGSHIEWRALVEEEEKGRLTWSEREARVQKLRSEAIDDVISEAGEDQILSFAISVKHPEFVAQILAPRDAPPEVAAKWIMRTLSQEACEASDTFLRQTLWTSGLSDLNAVVPLLINNGALNSAGARNRIAANLPGCASGWTVAEALGSDVAEAYWFSARVTIWDDTPQEEAEHAINKLLDANRPRSALSAATYSPDKLTPELWERVLQAIAHGLEPDGPLPDAYQLDEVLACLDNAGSIEDHRIAAMELPFVRLLCHHGHRQHKRTLALHRELARDPALFVQLLSWHYRRRDGTDDPEEAPNSEERREFLAKLAYHTLQGWNTVPGLSESGELSDCDFNTWADEAFRRASGVDRREVAETHLGALLARLARRRSWEDWLPPGILEFLDRPEHGSLREKFDLGIRNARGVTSRSPYAGGAQERKLAEKYRSLASRYTVAHPRVAALLNSIADRYDRDAQREDERAALGERWRP